MTDKEKAIVMAYTGICMLTGNKFQIFHKYVEDIMDRPIMTHEMGLLENVIKEKSKADFIALCRREGSAHWTTDFTCSNCGCKCYPMDIDFGDYNYCPNCGARMEEGENNV